MRSGRFLELASASLLAFGSALGGAEAAKTGKEPQHWTTVRSAKLIPPRIVNVLRSEFSSDNRLADVGEPFDATDVLTGLPQRRLVLAGHTAAEWFIAYEHGGRGHHLDLVVFNTQHATPKLVAAFGINAGKHDDANGWQLSLDDLEPILDGPRPTGLWDLHAH